MMSFKELNNIQLSYNSLSDEIVSDFYIPCLEKAVLYKRAVGFFSSNILLQISKGLGAFADNGGKMRLLISPQLDKEDYEAIKNGYDARQYVADKIVNSFKPETFFEQKEDRFEMLAYMIASSLLEIKVVFVEEHYDSAMFHRKVGIMEDEAGNKIAFSGSGNETFNGYNWNDEEIEVYCSWKSDESDMRCSTKEMSFDKVWNGIAKGLITIPFPDVIKNEILRYGTNEKKNYIEIDNKLKELIEQKKYQPKIPQDYKKIDFLFDYQTKAISEWEKRNYKGIFDMATGTGKTFTAGGAICNIYTNKKRVIVIVCCPFTHLVDQWCEELPIFGIEPIKCYGKVDYEKKLTRAFTKFKQKRSNFLCAVITNSSFKKENIQNLIEENIQNVLLIVDEAHNFGAYQLSKTLEKNYPYRLALSATLERYGDETGTAKLFNFFGEKCIEYTLQMAIYERKLTPYKYYPIPVYLDENEYDEYVKLSKQIAKFHCKGKKSDLPEAAKRLLIKRARIVAGAQEKIPALRKVIEPYSKEYNMLIYCGAVKYGDIGYDDNEEEKKQISVVLDMLNNDLHIYSSKFTAEEDPDLRHEIIKSFKQQNLQALVAIKCLDEGMNIPAIKTAFILASSTNPKEYIQRRGRVLRKFEGKDYAEIYDFITLPRPLDEVASFGNQNLGIEKNLARKEMERMIDFAMLAKNPSDSNSFIYQIREVYNMDIIMDEEEDYE